MATEQEIVLGEYSDEAEYAGQGRKWSVNLRESFPKSLKLTLLGEGVSRLRQQCNDWLRKRFKSLSEGEGFADFEKLDQTRWELLAIEAKTPDERHALEKQYQEQLLQILAGKRELKMAQFEVLRFADLAGKWEQVDGRIRMYPMIRFALRKASGPLPMHWYEAIATIMSKQPIDPAKFMDDTPPPDWDLISVEVTAVTSAEPKSK